MILYEQQVTSIMNQEIEIEFKQLIGENTYNAMLEHFKDVRTPIAEQTNHYFDTEMFELRDAGAALRVRNKSNRYILTLKEPHDKGLLETHQEITNREFTVLQTHGTPPDGDVAKRIAELISSSPHLDYLGYLKTARSEVTLDKGLLVLDRSEYFNFVDYELEFECTDEIEGQLAFSELLSEWQLQKNTPPNKIQRFFQAKTERFQD